MTAEVAVRPRVSRLADLVVANGAEFGCAPCYLDADGSRVLGYAELAQAVERCRLDADHLLRQGPIGLAITDPLLFARTFVGLIAAGCQVAPLDPAIPPAAFLADAEDLGLAALVSDRTDLGAPAVPRLRPAEWETALPHPTEPDETTGSVLLRSSGTTGPRKQLVLSERQLLHTAHEIARHHELTPTDRGFNPLPLFHVNAEVVGLLATLASGSSLVLADRFHRNGFWETVARHEVTWINAVPAILAILSLDTPLRQQTAGIRFARSASAPLAPAVLDRFEAATGIPILETYGMTEAASQITANPLRGPRRAGSVGLPVGCELQVRGDAGPCPAGVTGAVHIRGAGVIPGPLPGSWLNTGDLGYLDADGYLFLTGRVDDVINRGGEKIFPRRIEDVLLADPDVAAAVVVGLPDSILGSVPVAFVTPATEIGPDEARQLADRLRANSDEQLVRIHRPVRIDVVAELPLGATGKLSRRRAQQCAAELTAQRWATA